MRSVLSLGLLIVAGAVWGQTVVPPPLPDEVEPSIVKIEGVTFAAYSGRVFVPVREIGPALKVYVGWDDEARQVEFDGSPIPESSIAKLMDGTNLVDVSALKGLGFKVSGLDSGAGFLVESRKGAVEVIVSEKWVEISLDEQELTAWQGSRLVLRTNVSTGKPGFRTPTGEFKAGPEKAKMRYSRTYDNSPMPYAVQLYKGYFVHGYPSVPSFPASHGCIRMPLTKGNPAKVFFEWVDLGTSVVIVRGWSEKVSGLLDDGIEARVKGR